MGVVVRKKRTRRTIVLKFRKSLNLKHLGLKKQKKIFHVVASEWENFAVGDKVVDWGVHYGAESAAFACVACVAYVACVACVACVAAAVFYYQVDIVPFAVVAVVAVVVAKIYAELPGVILVLLKYGKRT